MDTKIYFQLLSQLIKLNPNKIIFVDFIIEDEETCIVSPYIRCHESLVLPSGFDLKIPSNISQSQVEAFLQTNK